MKRPIQIFQEMQQLDSKEEMVSYLRSLPKMDEPCSDNLIDSIGTWTGSPGE